MKVPARLSPVLSFLLLIAIGPAGFARADERGLAAAVAAGEFGPASLQIQRISAPERKNDWWSRLALAQAAAGAGQAALATVDRIDDPTVYSETLAKLAAEPVTSLPARGGGTQADFDSLIELITTTVAPTTWDEVGGPGAIDGFEGGVYVDAAGVLRKTPQPVERRLETLRWQAGHGQGGDWRKASPFRKVSLPRLERAVLKEYATGRAPTEAMRLLAGLYDVTHVLVYPETGDLVLAGPAGDYRRDREGRLVNVATGRPLLRLDDLVVVLRNALEEQSKFGCSITPRQANLAATKAFLAESGREPLRPQQRNNWLETLRETLGRQDVSVYGLDPHTRAGRVLVEADYRMKLVGMGLEPGVLGVSSYLDSIEVQPGEAPPPMDVLRWWFTLDFHEVATTERRDAFALRGPGAQVKSENELLSDLGQRIHTGQASDLNAAFARSFTAHFDALADKYAIYAELRNVFDLALAAAIVVEQDLPAQCDWTPTHFAADGGYRPQREFAPTEVDTVMNHRVVDRRHIVAGVSGGVRVDARSLVRQKEFLRQDEYGLVKAARGTSRPPTALKPAQWWWD